MLDVFMLTYNEKKANENFELLKEKAPNAKRIDNVTGILNAHREAASQSTTDNFYIVDADAVLVDHFDFSFEPSIVEEAYPGINESSCAFVWRSINPVNDLIYGYGAVKLFPKHNMLNTTDFNVDMTTSLGIPLVVKNQISNITQFNTDEFGAWRSAFRECTKLASNIIDYNISLDDKYRLDVWCSRGEDKPFGKQTVLGARQGRDFGIFYKDDPVALSKINDFKWLQKTFYEAT